MSRSIRKTPITGVTTARSEKSFKSAEHQRERSAVRTALPNAVSVSDLPNGKLFGDPWDGPKDGKVFRRRCSARLLRK